MNILILEDSDKRINQFQKKLIGHSCTFTKTAQECIALLNSKKWDVLFLDHDLGGKAFVKSGTGTGYEVALYLRTNLQKCPAEVIVHSVNPVGAKNICDTLEKAKHVPFAWV
jgi:hypothetical protein